MSEKRMFTQKITESDAFLDMPLSSQALYFHLCMYSDDDGFVKNPKRICKMVGGSDDDYKLLLMKCFAIPFDSGVVVIKHWRMHNIIRKDRYRETEYVEEKSMLYVKKNGAYTLDSSKGIPLLATNPQPIGNQSATNMATKWQPNDNQYGNQMATEIRLDKISIDKNINNILSSKSEKSATETIKIIVDYLNEKTGSHYKANSKTTSKHIKARLSEGYTYDDFVVVIDKKYDEWKGTDYEKFLRPETLFGTKFESYLNQKVTKNVKGDEYEHQFDGNNQFLLD